MLHTQAPTQGMHMLTYYWNLQCPQQNGHVHKAPHSCCIRMRRCSTVQKGEIQSGLREDVRWLASIVTASWCSRSQRKVMRRKKRRERGYPGSAIKAKNACGVEASLCGVGTPSEWWRGRAHCYLANVLRIHSSSVLPNWEDRIHF